jgi:hypothetical protein
MKVSLIVEGEDIELFILKKDETDYFRLAKALLERVTDNQLQNLIQIRGNKKFILFTDLIKQYKFEGKVNEGLNTCICGVKIKTEYVIKNIDTKMEYIIGSVCKDNWFLKDCISYYCKYCDRRKTNNNDCLNCEGKKDLKTLFCNWRTLIKDKVDFGKYKGLISYYKMTNTYPSYCKWIVNESCITQNKKHKISTLCI